MTNSFVGNLRNLAIALTTLGFCPALAQSPPPEPTALVDALKPKIKARALDLGGTAAEQLRSEKRKKDLDVLRTKGTRGLSVEEKSDLPDVVSDRPSVDLEVYF